MKSRQFIQWVKMSDRGFPIKQRFLVVHKNGDIQVVKYQANEIQIEENQIKIYLVLDEGWIVDCDDFTHWSLLPGLPNSD